MAGKPKSRTLAEVGLRGDGWVSITLRSSPWQFEAYVATVDGSPQVLGLRIEPRQDAGHRVSDWVLTSERLRAIPLRRIREAASAASRLEFEKALEALITSDTRPTVGEVAAFYRAALQAGEPPRKAIAERWEVSRATASNWIRAAREAGELGRPERPGLPGDHPVSKSLARRGRRG